MIKALIFDFDGVIHNTFEFHFDKLKKFTGKDITRDDYKNIHNGNIYEHKKHSDKLSFDDTKGYADWVYNEQVRLKIDNAVKKEIESLSKKHKLFIVTSSNERNIGGYLKNNSIQKAFVKILGFETHKSKEVKFKIIIKDYKLKKEECLFITDTLGDLIEAKNAGLPAIAVDFGFHERERLEKGKPIRIISSFNEIDDVIDQIQ